MTLFLLKNTEMVTKTNILIDEFHQNTEKFDIKSKKNQNFDTFLTQKHRNGDQNITRKSH